MNEAQHYRKTDALVAECLLCPRFCVIHDGKYGNCKVRQNQGGTLYALNYGRLSAIHSDPIEKKPLYHFYPGSSILSIGSIGCNLHCRFCQNSGISQSSMDDIPSDEYLPSEIAAAAANKAGNTGVAYTYNEPTVFYEFMIETARLIHERSLKNVVVSNGYINSGPLEELIEVVDAFNIDLKSFNDKFYREVSGGSLQPVLDTLKLIRSKNKHLEVTCLVVPELNDQRDEFEAMTEWIAAELGKETVLHISRYFPRYQASALPTPESTMLEFHKIALNSLHYVYLGNIGGDEGHDTVCPGCRQTVIHRSGYTTSTFGLDEKGNCIYCGKHIAVR